MSSSSRYEYDVAWRVVTLSVIFNVGISLIMVLWAVSIGGILSAGPIFLGVTFALLALWIIVRRLIFSQALELTENAIVFHGGFSGKRITRIAFEDIMRMRNLVVRPGLLIETMKTRVQIDSGRFKNPEYYRAVEDFICSKTSLWLPKEMPTTRDLGWVPGPILQWSEPEDYIRYRTYVAVSKPLWLRLARTIRFFVCCFGFFFIPWLFLNFLLGQDAPDTDFLAALIPASLFFTLLYWLFNRYPARAGRITVYKDGIHELSGKQQRTFGFGDFLGWSVAERKFEERVLYILLLKRPKWVYEVALPDMDTRDRFVQMLNERKIPHLDNLEPSWESQS